MDILIFHMRMEKSETFDKTEGIGESDLSNC